jgi:trimethylamine--corrinoid protein Co-methyltransferase
MSRADLAGSVGDVEEDVALTASLVKVVLDCEAHAHGRAYLRSFEISDDTLALDVIKQVGPGGNFLGERHTVDHFRREFFHRKSSDPFILDPESKGSLVDRAKAKVREILSTHQPLPIEESVHEEMARILREAEKDLV